VTLFHTRIDIAAPKARVWQVLTEEMPNDPQPFGILKLEGRIAQDGRIKLWSEVAPNRAFALTVTVFDAPTTMVWMGGMPLGLFIGTRRFEISETDLGCTFDTTEVFSGPLAGLIGRSMPDLTPSFVKFATTLKEKAETT